MSLGSGRGCFVCLWRCRLLSVPSPIGRAGLRKEVGLLTWPEGALAPNGTVMWPGAQSTRDGDTGIEDDSSFAGFLNLTNIYAMFK